MYNFNIEHIDDFVIIEIHFKNQKRGFMKMKLIKPTLKIFDGEISVIDFKNDINIDLFKLLFRYCKKYEYTIESELSNNVCKNYINNLLTEACFKCDKNICYYVKNSDCCKSPFVNDYKYEHYLNRGEEYFINCLKKVSTDDLLYKNKSIEGQYRKWKEKKYCNEFWNLVYKDNELIGLILPFKNKDFPTVGNIAYIGIVPEKRGNKHGYKLHNIAIEKLFGVMHVEIYLGMTHVDNSRMRNIMERNGCIHQNVIVFNTGEQ